MISERLRTAARVIEAGEGGPSRATTDTASANPSPWVYQGKTGWHTNRGITYSTFSANASKLGYKNDADTFFNMPDEVWFKIFKRLYWDAVQADRIKSDALAIYATSWVWGSGAAGGRSRLRTWLRKHGYDVTDSGIPDAINKLAAKVGEQLALNSMLDDRAAQFRALNQPANLKGWLNRLERYRVALTDLIKKKTK